MVSYRPSRLRWLASRCRLRTMERLYLEQARLCALPESRAALEELVRNYRAAIDGGADWGTIIDVEAETASLYSEQ